MYLALRLVFGGALGYDGWAGMFVPLPMKIVTLVALLALFYHAWIGVRDIWMDYVKPTWVRLSAADADGVVAGVLRGMVGADPLESVIHGGCIQAGSSPL